ncbi:MULTISPECIES: helix-turn-helix domain-containing protein [unclassified Rhodococcus (in: high G+C Gram-positive bacteria)]|uniref:helix-turn-helix domain-containing protein n=1 Tax=unclassified Rhodococcus (in: high G+C Gram-positive bacteria) TaxID=192944 RepID=UPI000B9A3278|nr:MULTISPECIES: helix-turn-helix transcriptional regulator [unclassified Rhodococcus (in: high G+C Gram-positive bacteria)]OZE42315.1 transcriptional regulator [Rhodococcus sp. 05-2254-4]OZE50088.1 transcriptional regulator [Rhodococcus sp. 05-2254-3]OZE50951.1 transcriptional regulator [Rhodococcus sp. 05-2254-2]
MSTQLGRDELAAFLRARREALSPSEVGLPPRIGASRTPGLRREEVAALAGVSVDYLVRLEQARDVRPSAQVVQSLSNALKLSTDQTGYLFTLAGHRAPERSTTQQVPEGIRQLIDDVAPLPAMVLDHRLDILATNEVMAALLLDIDRRPVADQNVLRMCFLDNRFDGFYEVRDDVVRGAVADLRAAWVNHSHDAELAALIDELERGSAEFSRYWQSREVAVRNRGDKPMRHPLVGPITVTFDVLTPLGDPNLRMIVYRPADAQSRSAIDELDRLRSRQRHRHLRTI